MTDESESEMEHMCHQDEVAITHWLCSECGFGAPWCYSSIEDCERGVRFTNCPGCGRKIDWTYWDRHLHTNETAEQRLVSDIAERVMRSKPVVIEDDGLPADDDSSDLTIFSDVRHMLAAGMDADEIVRGLTFEYYRVTIGDVPGDERG